MKVYHLKRSGAHVLPGRNYDAWLESFPAYRSVRWTRPVPPSLPSVVEFRVERSLRGVTDMPFTTPGWPLMSLRLIEALAEPTVAAFVAHLRVAGGAVDHDYRLVWVPSVEGAFSRERSEWSDSVSFPNEVCLVTRLALRASIVGFPTVFCPAEWHQHCVTEPAAERIAAAGIVGIELEELEVGDE